MATAIAAAAANAAIWVANASYSALTAVGVSASTAAVVSSYAASITIATVVTLAQVGPALLFRPNVPTPEFARQVKRQPIPDRQSGYGRARVGGAYMLYETDGTNEGLALNVFAMHDGLIAGWGDIYLNDQKVTVGVDTYVETGPDLRYGKFGDLVRIETRLGEPTETNYAAVTAERPDLWPSNARGDGIASLMMIAKAKEKEQFQRDYPNGLPLPSAVGDLQYCWDMRLGARGTITDDADKAASATWVGGSQNPILQLLDYMTNVDTGLGYPLTRFLPNIAAWETAADVCDEAVPLAAGGTVPRYQSGGLYLHSTAPADVIATILATCDGWLAQDATGCFTIQAGEYVEPTVTITEAHIVNLSRQFWREDEKASNEIVISFTDPAFDYTEVETTPWRMEDDIDARGDVRSQRLSLPWVQNNSQARRLAKIAATKATAPVSGTITTTLDGLRAWSERRIRIQAPSDGETMADIVVDILPLTLNPDMTVSIPFVSCDPTAYDWTTGEETDGAGEDTRPPPVLIPQAPANFMATVSGNNVNTSFSIIDDHGRVYRGGPTATFGTASDVSGEIPAVDGILTTWTNFAVAPGTYQYWATAEDAADTPSDESGPITVNVTQEAGTNLLVAPNDFTDAAWSKSAVGAGTIPVVTANAGLAPDGSMTADRIQFVETTGGTDQSFVSQALAGANIVQNGAIWLKSNTGGNQTLYIRTGGTFQTVTAKPYWDRYTVVSGVAARGFYMGLREAVLPGVTSADVLVWQGHLSV